MNDRTRPANDAASAVLTIRRDPLRFVVDVFGQDALGKQRDILEALAKSGVREVHVKACHGAGKTFIVSRAVAWFLNAYPQDSIVLTTAPSWPQVEDQIWREIRDGAAKAKVNLGGRLLKTSWELGPKWYATGIATSPDTAVNVQGYHAAHVLVIVDEADGVARPIWDAVDGLATSAHVVVLAIGNPINPQSAWRKRYEHALTDPHAVCIKISADDVLPLTDTGKHPYLLQRWWTEDKKQRWGESSALYIAKVLAEWPDQSSDTLIPIAWLERARGRDVPRGLRVLGVDVARFGSARTVRTMLEGSWLAWSRATSLEDTMVTAGRVLADIDTYAITSTAVDDTGLGGGVTDRLRQLGNYVQAVNFGGKAWDDTRFANRGAELWWQAREAFEQGLPGFSVADPDAIDELIADLNRPTYSTDAKGRIVIDKYGLGRQGERSISAEDRIARSPDRGDSFVIALGLARPTIRIDKPARRRESEVEREIREMWEDHNASLAGNDPWTAY